MRILTTLTYCSPHVSGLTVYARRIVRRLVARGHDVTVLTSHYDPSLPAREVIDGASIVRSRVLLRVSKGTLMPAFFWDAARLIPQHDLVYLHLPQFEASGVALLAKMMRKPVAATYHCDIELPSGAVRALSTPLIRASNYLAGKFADCIVVNTKEYGHTARLTRHFHQKVSAVYPPIELADEGDGAAFRRARCLGDGPLVGFAGRFAEEKGIAYLIDAIPIVLRDIPNARFVLAGPTESVPGEHVHERLQPRLAALGSAALHLGLLHEAELASFYRAIDVLVLPSTNSTESFGMAQVEAMLCGTPVVASDFPGVREAVRVTGMGLLAAPRDPEAIARAVVAILRRPQAYVKPERDIRALFDPERTADFYEELFSSLVKRREPPIPH